MRRILSFAFRLTSQLRSFFFVLAGMFLTVASANAVTQIYDFSYDANTHGPDPVAVCLAAAKLILDPRSILGTPVMANFNGTSDTVATCHLPYTDAGHNSTALNLQITRRGNTCPAGSTFNTVTGTCPLDVLPPGTLCADQTGGTKTNPMIYDPSVSKCVLFSDSSPVATCKFIGNASTVGQAYEVAGVIDAAGNATAPPTFANDLGCEVSTIATSHCVVDTQGAATCAVFGKFSGNVGVGSKDIKNVTCGVDGTPCVDPVPTTNSDSSPCTMAGPASSQTCTTTQDSSQQGTQNCGGVGGQFTCVTVPPKSNGISIVTTQTSTTNADGSADVVKTDNATKTTCTDIKTCTTVTSTTTTTTHTTSAGGTKTTTTCKGTCNGDGTGLQPGKGGNNGTGDDGGGTAAASDDCAKPVICDGDIYLCAILNQEYLDTCSLRKMPTDKDNKDLSDSIDKENAEIAAHQKVLDDTGNTVVSAFESATGSTGGGGGAACLPDYPFSVKGQSLTLKFSATCDVLANLRYAILCIAFLFASYRISKEI